MIFVDSTAWIALELPDDARHDEAVRAFAKIRRGTYGTIVTSDYVLSESLAAVRMEGGLPAAERVATRVLDSRSVRLVWTESLAFRQAWERMRSRRDKRWSLVDCLRFVHMEELGISTALAFDEDFAQAGFSVLADE